MDEYDHDHWSSSDESNGKSCCRSLGSRASSCGPKISSSFNRSACRHIRAPLSPTSASTSFNNLGRGFPLVASPPCSSGRSSSQPHSSAQAQSIENFVYNEYRQPSPDNDNHTLRARRSNPGALVDSVSSLPMSCANGNGDGSDSEDSMLGLEMGCSMTSSMVSLEPLDGLYALQRPSVDLNRMCMEVERTLQRESMHNIQPVSPSSHNLCQYPASLRSCPPTPSPSKRQCSSLPPPKTYQQGQELLAQGQLGSLDPESLSTSPFDISPMAQLMREYSSVSLELQLSPTEASIMSILSLGDLTPDLIVDRGENRTRGLRRYHLAKATLDNICMVVMAQQIFVQRAAALMVEGKSQFIVDPRDTLIPILQGTNSLPQLYVAWKALMARMRLGVKTWGKYVAEYQLQVGTHC